MRNTRAAGANQTRKDLDNMATRIESGECVGYIQLVFFDHTQGEVVVIGGAGFATRQADDAAWEDIPEFSGETSFMADRLDAQRDIVEDKPVSVETCERLMGKSIAQLIADGRASLQAELAAVRNGFAAGSNTGARQQNP
jgi:hypothetical protein